MLTKIRKIPVVIKNRILNKFYSLFKIPTLKQEMLLRLALEEKGLDPKKLDLKCNHDLGINFVNGIEFGIKYPDSFFYKAQKQIPFKKKFSFYFNGNMSTQGEREQLLKPFKNLKNCLIIASNEGRIVKNKDKFNTKYFELFANSRFGLCPHQVNWEGNLDELWTYRFVESCFVESVPILFRKTPLSNNFVEGFYFLWDDQVLEMYKKNELLDFNDKVKENTLKAKQKFCFTANEIELIKNSTK